MNNALEMRQLSRSFGAANVLSGIDFALSPGERLAVVGASGSGKTTLLRLISGLDIPTRGDILIGGRIVSQPERILVPPEQRNVAMVFQGLALIPHLNALDQIAFAAPGRDGHRRATRLLDRVGLAHRARATLDQLSGGERQRIALARALVQQPALLLTDEPFASLDDLRREEMRELLRSLLDETQATLILVTHAREDALSLANRVMILHAGRPVVCDVLSNVLANPRHVAAVACLGLGQVINGETNDGHHVQTAFGVLQSSKAVTPGRVRLLIRPAQPRLSTNGVEAEIISLEPRPSAARNEIVQLARVRSGGEILRVCFDDGIFQIGQHIKLVIDGPCTPLDG